MSHGSFQSLAIFAEDCNFISIVSRILCNFAALKTRQEKGKSKRGFLGSEGFRFQAVTNCFSPMAFMSEHGGMEGFRVLGRKM